MAVESISSGNWSTDAASCWDSGSRPGDADDVIIKDGHNITISQDERANSVTIEDNATLTISGTRTIVIDGKDGSSYSFRAISGSTISGTLNVKVEGDGGYISEQGTNSINDLEVDLDSSSEVHYLDADLSITGNLTITEGIFNTNGSSNRALTVAGTTTIGDGSASATEATLTCNNSDVSLGSGMTSGYAVIIEVGGFFNGGTGTHTMGSFKIGADNALAKATLTTGTTNINAKSNDSNKAFRIAGSSATFSHPTNGTILMNYSGASSIQTSTKSLYNLTLNHASCDVTLVDALTVANNLTITAGTLDTDSSNNYALTVTGQCNVNGGTLTLNGSTCDFGDVAFSSGTINGNTATIDLNTGTVGGWVWYQTGGTWNHNTSTVVYKSNGKHIRSNNFYNLTIECSSSAHTGVWRDNSGGEMVIANDLTVKEGTFKRDAVGDKLEVDGDVIIESGGTLGNATTDNVTGADEFGSLEIQSGGEYIATSGTTTITTGGTIAGTTNMAFGGEGTFTHNNGTLVLDSTLHRIPTGGTFYNLTLNGEQSVDGIYGYTTTMLPQGIMPDGTTGSGYMSILGTLQINHDEFRPYNTDKIYVHNLIIGDGTGSANSAKFDMSEADTFDGKVFVDNVTIHSDGQLLFGDGDETSTTEGSSALNISGAFRNLGGSVDIA
tara:strand:+ start:24 stop:2027 length:2004 start_codon:yes stop_codon:yes gene_type:complete